MNAYPIPLWQRLTRCLAKPVFRMIFHTLAGVRIQGMEKIPDGQPYLAAINHVSLFDPPFALSFWPEMVEAMGAAEIWSRPGQNILVRLYGVIPVHRYDYDRALFDKALAALRAGRPLLLAPEGGRSHTPGLQRARPGVAYLADETGLPVVPVGIVGTTDDFWKVASRGHRPQLKMIIGEPFVLPRLVGRGSERRWSRQHNADLIMQRIAALLPVEYRGVYDGRLLDETGGPEQALDP